MIGELPWLEAIRARCRIDEHLGIPVGMQLLQFGKQFGHPGLQIAALPRIGDDVEQEFVLVDLEVFVATAPDRLLILAAKPPV